jgi:hypothetical protein
MIEDIGREPPLLIMIDLVLVAGNVDVDDERETDVVLGWQVCPNKHDVMVSVLVEVDVAVETV